MVQAAREGQFSFMFHLLARVILKRSRRYRIAGEYPLMRHRNPTPVPDTKLPEPGADTYRIPDTSLSFGARQDADALPCGIMR